MHPVLAVRGAWAGRESDVNRPRPQREVPMNRIRMAALAALTVCAVSLGAAGTASAAQEPADDAADEDRRAHRHEGLQGHVHDRPLRDSKGGKLVAVGTLKGTMRKNGTTKRVSRKNVVHARRRDRRRPRDLRQGLAAAAAAAPGGPGLPGPRPERSGRSTSTCSASSCGRTRSRCASTPSRAPNNLLGNLLCAVTGLLNPTGALGQLTGAINQLAAALNAILALVPTSPATGAAAVAGR